MLKLAILRHAKSSWADAQLDDFDRPLNGRGRKAAASLGASLVAAGVLPQMVLCSPAVRTRQTLELFQQSLHPSVQICFEPALYLATVRTLLETIRRCSAENGEVLLVGHNPGLHGLALMLVRDGDPEAVRALSLRFPTGALATLSFDAASFSKLQLASGRLDTFVTPARDP